MSESTTPNEGHKGIRKTVKAYKTVQKLKKQEKLLKDQVKTGVVETSSDVDAFESRAKNKIENFTKKIKNAPKNFKTTSKNQLQELFQTYFDSLFESNNTGRNDESPNQTVKQIDDKLTAIKQKNLANEKARKENKPLPFPNVDELRKENETLNSELKKAQIYQFNTATNRTASQTLRNILIQTMTRSKEEIKDILSKEIVSGLGCSQDQTYEEQIVYIKVKSIDIFGKTLQTNPFSSPGQYIYEVADFSPTTIPRAFNKELWNRIQNEESFQEQYNISYLGASGQELFDIQFVKDPTPSLSGEFFKVTLKPRVGGNTVVEFLTDYINTIDVLNFNELFSNVMNLMLGAIDMKNLIGYDDLREQTRFEKLIQRVLGLCFDNRQEIDVSGTGKLDTLDQIDDSFFILDDNELLEIETRVKNVQERVIQFKDCGSLYLPVNVDASLSLLDEFLDVGLNASDAEAVAQKMLDSLGNNKEWMVLFPQFGSLEDVINTNFSNLLPIAMVNSVLSPKHLFPLMVMAKALQKEFVDNIETQGDFFNEFRKLVINISSNIQAIFIRELFKAIKANLRKLVATVVQDTVNDILNNKQKMILNGLNLALTSFAALEDFKRCKNIIDELKRIVSLSFAIRAYFRGDPGVPPIINYIVAQNKPGISPTSILERFVEKMDEIGAPTGDLPSGRPNTGLLVMKGLFDSINDEIVERGVAETTIFGKDVAQLTVDPTASVKIKGNIR